MNSITAKDLAIVVKSIKKEAKKLAGKTILISGGAGFIGSYIVAVLYLLNRRVLTSPCKVISIDNYITGSRKNFLVDINDDNFNFINADIRSPLLINDQEKVDYIIHAAGLASPHYYKKFPVETIESAILGAKNLLELARTKQAKSLLFFSSSEIYGDPDPKFIPTPETYTGNVSSIGPRACYDESKRLAETLCIAYHQVYQVPAKIIRLFNVYGPGMKHTDYRVIPNFVYKGLTGEHLPVHDKGIQTRTFCYISDALQGIFKTLISGKAGEVYNIGNSKPEISMYELAMIVTDLIGGKAKPKRKNYPPDYPAGEPQRRCPDISKIETELKYQPTISLKTGLRRTINWFKEAYKL